MEVQESFAYKCKPVWFDDYENTESHEWKNPRTDLVNIDWLCVQLVTHQRSCIHAR
jgi:hypothetical protein